MAKGNPNWTNGISGNPNGRPKDEFGILIRKQKGLPKQLFDKVIEITNSANETNKLKAIEFLAERGWGKPIQAIEGDIKTTGMLKIETVNYGK